MPPGGKLGRSSHNFRVDQLSILGVRVAPALERLQKLGVQGVGDSRALENKLKERDVLD